MGVEAKPFALGFRAEHPQGLINSIQYGTAAKNPKLPPADYKLAENLDVDGEVRGVYSFCMCPGGIVVPTPTQEGLQCTNGMSNSRRNAKYANAGIVVSVSGRRTSSARASAGRSRASSSSATGRARRTSWAEGSSAPPPKPSPTTSPGA